MEIKSNEERKERVLLAGVHTGKKDVLADTLGYLGVEQKKCVIFEDFAPTMHAAMNNGVYAVGVCHDFNSLADCDCDEMISIHKEVTFY